MAVRPAICSIFQKLYYTYTMDELIQKENARTLEGLLDTKGIQIEPGALFGTPVLPKPRDFDFGKVEGMLLGTAVGDALGAPTEGMLPAERRAAWGEVRDYLPGRHGGESRGYPTDDTQLSFWTLEQLMEDRGLIPENLADKFAHSGRIYGIGATVRKFLGFHQAGLSWELCGPHSAGNGALMRIAPILVPHLKEGGPGLWIDTALAAMLTHNDEAAISSCLVFTALLWELLDRTSPPEKGWWVERYVELARDLEGETIYLPRGGRYRGYSGPLWRFVEEKLAEADRENLSVVDACNGWYSGAYLLETLPSVLYILMRHGHDPEEAVVRAVNDTRDNDTIAAVVGAAVGALHGRRGLPERWIENLSGRTGDNDDRRIFGVIEKARRIFWEED